MSEKRGKKRPKSYYIKCAHKRQRMGRTLGPDMRGFLTTCNSNEKGAVRELYNILNEYGDLLYGPEKLGKPKSDQKASAEEPEAADAESNREEEEGDSDEEEDMEKAMAKELNAMKEAAATPRRFQNIHSPAKNCIFIQTTLEKPEELAEAIFHDLLDKKIQKTRFAIRMLPIQGTCKAQLDNISKLAQELFPKYFRADGGVTYSINVKVRNNNSGIGRESIIPELGTIIHELNELNHVNHTSPDYVILVEIVCKVCCLSVVQNYTKFRKYNLIEVGKDKPVEAVAEAKEDEQTESESEKKQTALSVSAVGKEEGVVETKKEEIADGENGETDEAMKPVEDEEVAVPNSAESETVKDDGDICGNPDEKGVDAGSADLAV